MDNAIFWIQLCCVVGLACFFLIRYRAFHADLLKFLINYKSQTAVGLLLFTLVYGQLGTSLGAPHLIWDENPATRLFSAAGATLVLALLGTNAYYLMPEREQLLIIERVVELERRLHSSFLSKQINRALSWLSVFSPGRLWSRKRRLGLAIGIAAAPWLFVWRLTHRLSNFLEIPRETSESAWELRLFLRTMQLPFLTLLALPALFPELFPTVPRQAPIEFPLLRRLGEGAGGLTVTLSPLGYALGVVVWLGGIVLGIYAFRLGIRLSLPLSRALNRASRFLRAQISSYRWMRVLFAVLRKSWKYLVLGSNRPEAQTDLSISPRKRKSIAAFIAVVLIVYGTLAFSPIYGSLGEYSGIAPGFAICAFLGIIAMVGVCFALAPRRLGTPLLILTLGWIGWANHDPFKNRFENLDYRPESLVSMTDFAEQGYLRPKRPTYSLISNSVSLENWKRRLTAAGASGSPGKPKLVVVCVSGGATRSGYWAAVVLDRLEKTVPNFHANVRVVTGASGGMYGASHYVKWLYDRSPHRVDPHGLLMPEQDWFKQIPAKSLWPVARSIALRDSWKLFWPGTTGDRGIELEKDWKELRAVRMIDLRPFEETGEIPSLIFSPMTVDDGRRLLISNLDLRNVAAPAKTPTSTGLETLASDAADRFLALSRGSALADDNEGGRVAEYSLSAVEFFKLFPNADDFLLSTAVRMNASFPFLSPAVNLPTDPPLRVVDAGYYDNYGVDVAASWLAMNFEWILENTSGVVLLQIRDSLSYGDRFGYPRSKGAWGNLLSGFQFFTSVADGTLEGRNASSVFRNDQLVAVLSDRFTRATFKRAFFTTVVFENSAFVTVTGKRQSGWPNEKDVSRIQPEITDDVSMSWNLTHFERRAIETAIPPNPPAESPWANRDYRLDRIKVFEDLATRGQTRLSSKDKTRRQFFLRQLERLRNYERLQVLTDWWKVDHSAQMPKRQ